MSSAADRNLLFGILALQMDFVSREQLIAAMNAWVLEKASSIGQILLRQQALGQDERVLLDALVKKHLAKHGGDPERSLAAVSSIESVRDELNRLADSDVQATLLHVARGRNGEDPNATRTVGTPTSSGLRFRVLRPHAKGGLGEVFVAEDEELRREVALKQIQPHCADDPNSRSRFVMEAEITGGLEHPGIVPVYGLGTYANGRPFYAMRFIRGDSLKDAIKRFHSPEGAKLSVGERTLQFRKLLARFIDVCNAIEYAHSRGVLHRDLKPGNIMLGKYGETLVVDWGLAKAVGRTELTRTVSDEQTLQPSSGSGSAPTHMGSAIGTPHYIEPEQAAGRVDQLGPHSDVYSLGATLYSLLTGQSPLADRSTDSIGEVLRRVQQGDIPPPRQVKSDIPKPLEAICLKAMALKPADRYGSPRALADDIEHWLADEPIAALPDSIFARVSRFTRRHRSWMRAAAASLALLTAASIVGVVLVNAAKNEEVIAKQNAIAAERRAQKLADDKTTLARGLAHELFELGATEVAHGSADKGMLMLAHSFESMAEDDPLRDSVCRLLGTAVDEKPISLRQNGTIADVAYSPDGATVLTGGYDKTARLWDARTGKPLGEAMKREGKVIAVAYSPDCATVLTGSNDKTARLWDARTGKPVGEPMQHDRTITSVAFSPDGAKVVTGSYDFTARLWKARTGKPVGESMKHGGTIRAVAYSSDGATVLTGSDDGIARIWDAQTGTVLGETIKHGNWVVAVAYSPNGATVLTGSNDGTARLWDARTVKPLGEPMKHPVAVKAVAYSPDGASVLTGSNDGTARLWDARTGQSFGEPIDHRWPVRFVSYSPDGATVLTGGDDNTARLSDARTGMPLGEPMNHDGLVNAAVYSPDGATVLAGSRDGTSRLWDKRAGKPLGEPMKYGDGVSSMALSPDGATVLTGCHDGTARLWDARTLKPIGEPLKHERSVTSVAFSPRGTTLLTGSDDGTARIWDARTGKPLGEPMKHAYTVRGVAYSPDGATVLTGSNDATARLWDARTGKPLGEPMKHERSITSVAFSPRGTTVLTGSDDETVRLWDARTLKPLGEPMRHAGPVFTVTYGPDGATVLTGCGDAMVRLWDAQTGKPLGEPMNQNDPVISIAYSADGTNILAGTKAGTVQFWEARTGKPLGEPMKQGGAVIFVAYSADGATALTGNNDGMVRRRLIPRRIPRDLVSLLVRARTGLKLNDSGTIQTLSDAEIAAAWKSLESSGAEWLAETRRLDLTRTAGWHHYEAAEAAVRQDWFAATFHLRCLLKHDPNNIDLMQRTETAKRNVGAIGKLAFTKWVYPADERGLPGYFEKVDAGWREVKDNKELWRFTESSRTADYVELYDEEQKLRVRMGATSASWLGDRRNWTLIGKGAPVTDEPKPR